jgi:hypothetical protein
LPESTGIIGEIIFVCRNVDGERFEFAIEENDAVKYDDKLSRSRAGERISFDN